MFVKMVCAAMKRYGAYLAVIGTLPFWGYVWVAFTVVPGLAPFHKGLLPVTVLSHGLACANTL